MTTRKYKELVQERTRETLQKWSEQPEVKEKDIYRFLHNLKGTSGTVGLEAVEIFSGNALLYFSEDQQRSWTEAEWGIICILCWAYLTSLQGRVRSLRLLLEAHCLPA